MKKKVFALLLIFLVAVFATFGLMACVGTHDKLVESLEMYTLPKREYVLGEALNLDGAQVLVKYDDNTEKLIKVDESVLSTFDPNRVGEQVLVVTYGGRTTGFTVVVKQAQITDLILTAPDKLTYIEGQDLDLTGGEVTIVYANGMRDTVSLTAEMCVGYDRDLIGKQTVRVVFTAGGATKEQLFSVTVVEKTLQGIIVEERPEKTVYYPGEAVDLKGGVLFLQYDNGYPEYVNMTEAEDLTVQWDNTTVSSHAYVNLEYRGKRTAFEVQVLVRDVAGMRVITPLVEQAVELDLNLADALVEITYNNGDRERLFLAASDRVRILGYDKQKPGKQTITLVFYTAGVMNATTYQMEITVKDKAITGLEILPPEGTILYEDTRLDVIGTWQYRVLYSNGTKGNLEYVTDDMIARSAEDDVFYFDAPGTYSYTFLYQQTETVYEFEINRLEVEHIDLENADRVVAHLGHDLNVDGIVLSVTYANGAVRKVDLERNMIESFDASTLGETTVKIVYSDEYVDAAEVPMTVNVIRRVEVITEFSNPHKTDYLVDEAFDVSGLAVNLRYEYQSAIFCVDNFEVDWKFENDEWDENHRFQTIGTKQIYVTYAGLQAPDVQGFYLTVTVHNRITEVRVVQSLPNVVAGALLNTDGVELEISYEVGKKKRIPLTPEMTDYDYTDFHLGDRTLTVTYSDNDSTMSGYATVTVVPSAPHHLEVVADATAKTEYQAADRSAPAELEGLRVYVVFDNGTRKQLKTDSVNFGLLDVDNGGFKVSYNYNGTPVEGFFEVHVVQSTVISLQWGEGTPTVSVSEGIPFDWNKIRVSTGGLLKDCKVIKRYNDHVTESDITLSELIEEITVVGYNQFNTGTHYPQLYYRGLSLTFAVQVSARRLESIDITGDTVTVVEGAVPSTTGLRFELVYDNYTRTAAVLREDYFLYGENNLGGYDREDVTLGNRTVTVVYQGKTTQFHINVIQKSLVSVEMDSLPKIRYIEGEELDLDGGVVILTYDNGQIEKKPLTDAAINSPSSTFNVNTMRFDNSEFSGFAKLQTIYVACRDRDRVLETEFDITMRDRKYFAVEYDDNNVNTFYYGDIDKKYLQFKVWGYNDYMSATRERVMDLSLFTVEYVRYEDRFEPRDPGVDYTVLPKDAGQYVMIIGYDSEFHEDGLHNTMNEMSVIITIEPRVIYVQVADTVKTYGTENPQFYCISAMSEKKYRNPSLENDVPFAYGENFLSPGFADQSALTGCFALDPNGNVVEIFRIETLDANRDPIGLTTAAGAYIINIGGAKSQNYDIRYVRGNYTVERRHVSVIPRSVEVEYGVTNISIVYDTDVWDDGTADYQNHTGLFGNDTLSGNLMKREGTDVGRYLITAGTLTSLNRNYDVHFIAGEVGNEAAVTIYPRKIFLKAENVVYFYGETMPELKVEAFRDGACTDRNAFAFSTDSIESLGTLRFIYEITDTVGSFVLLTEIIKNEGDKGNYELSYIESTLRILPRPVTVTAIAGQKTYGESDPELLYSVEGTGEAAGGLMEGDTLSGSLTRAPGEAVGTYAIRIGSLQTENKNYKIEFRPAEFRIERKTVVLSLADEGIRKVYDGRLPSVGAEYMLFTDTDGNAVEDSALQTYVTIIFLNAAKNAGSYTVQLSNENNNYAVSFDRESYIYEIAQREVEIEYVDLPNGLEYKGDAYRFGAVVKDEYVQYQYNADGSIKTDENNRRLKDRIDVTLSLNTAAEAGTYTTKATLLSDVNYRLKDAAETAFTIEARTLVVKIHTVENTLYYQRAYNNQAASFTARDYDILNAIEGDTVLFSVRVVNPDGSQNPPKDVRYDAEGNIIAYQIAVDPPINANYRVELEEEYGYRIVPREVKVRIFETHLTKNFDGKEPSIESAMYNMDSASNLSPSTVSFTFERKENDLRPNHSVGNYQITLSCSDRNHAVSLERDYVYRINPAPVSVTVRGNALSKVYDEQSIAFAYNNLTLTSYSDIQPLIRNFKSNEELESVKKAVESLIDYAKAVYVSVGDIQPDGVANLKPYVDAAKNALSNFYAKFEESKEVLQTTTVNRVESEYTYALNALNGILAETEISSINVFLNNATVATRNIMETCGKENFYIAFVFTPMAADGDADLIKVGKYSFRMVQSDYNRTYRLTNLRTEYEITKWSITIEAESVTTVYGKTPEVMNYRFITVDSVTGELLYYDEEKNICRIAMSSVEDPYAYTPIVEGSLVRENADRYDANQYRIVLGSDISANPNYATFYNGSAIHTIARATIYLELGDDVGLREGEEIYYGDAINANMLKGWKYVSGLTAPYEGSEDVDDISVILDRDAVYSARYEGVEITSPDSGRIPAGEYELTATRFSSSNNNYSFSVKPGKVTVQKQKLNLDTFGGSLNRMYGDDSKFELTFSGLVDGETAEDILENGELPVLKVDKANSAENTYQPTADCGNYKGLYFATNDEGLALDADGNPVEFRNYILNIEASGYDVEVYPAPLTITILGNAYDDSIDITYGDVLTLNSNNVVSDRDQEANLTESVMGVTGANQYRIRFSGFRNDDTAATVKEGGNVAVPYVDMDRLQVSESGEFNYNNRMPDLQNYNDALGGNYELRFGTTQLNVAKKELQIYIGKTINVMYDPSAYNPAEGNYGYVLEPYQAEFSYEINREEGFSDTVCNGISVIRGQYYYTDIRFEGLITAWDNKDELFVTMGNDHRPKIPDSGNTCTSEGCLNSQSTYVHTLVYDRRAGENKELRLSGFQFLNGEKANYELVYPASTLNVYAAPRLLAPSTESVVLQGDTQDKLEVTLVDDSGNFYVYSVADTVGTDGKFTVTGFDSSTVTDSPKTAQVSYTRNFGVTQYTAPSSFVEESDGSEITVSNNLNESAQSGTIAATPIKYWVYAKNTSDVTVDIGAVSSVDASNSVQVYNSTDTFNYDCTEMTFRLSPTSSDSQFALVVNGAGAGTDGVFRNSLVLQYYAHRLSLVLYDADGNVIEVPMVDGDGNSVNVPNVIPILERAASGIRLLDGDMHTLVIQFNRLHNIVYVEVDGVASGYVSLTQLLEDGTPAYEAQMMTRPSLVLTGVKGIIKELRMTRIGYHDNAATLVSPNDASNVQAIQYISINGNNHATVTLTDFFLPQPNHKGYTYRYYVNGTNALTVEVQTDGTVTKTGEVFQELRKGYHTLKLEVADASGVFTSKEVTLWLTNRVSSVTVNVSDEAVELGGEGVDLFGYDYVPGQEQYFTNTTEVKTGVRFPVTFANLTSYRSIAMTFTFDAALLRNGSDDIRRQQATETLITLWANSANGTPKTPIDGYYGIAIGIEKPLFVQEASYNTKLYMALGSRSYSATISSDLNWEEGVMTTELYMNADNGSFTVLIYQNAVLVCNVTVDSNFAFGTTRLGASDITLVIAQQNSSYPAIMPQDSRIRLMNATANMDVPATYGYLVNGSYTENSGAVKLSAGQWLAQAYAVGSGYGQFFGSGAGQILKLDNMSATGAFRWYFNYTENASGAVAGRGMYLDYQGGTLKYVFYNSVTEYVAQVLATDLTLHDGAEHVLKVTYGTQEKGERTGIPSVTAEGEQIYYREVFVEVDGVSKVAYHPSGVNNLYHWLRQDGGSNRGINNRASYAEAFLTMYAYNRLNVTIGTCEINEFYLVK